MTRPRAGGECRALLLTLLVALGTLSTDLYLPSLPGIAADLGASAAEAQLTIGLFIAGFAAMMLVCGPLADRQRARLTLPDAAHHDLFTGPDMARRVAPALAAFMAACER